MLIRLNLSEGLACEHGILRAGQVQVLLDAQQARDETAAQCEARLDEADAQVRELIEQARAQADAIVQQAGQDAQAQLDAATRQARGLMEQAQQSIADATEEARRTAEREGAFRWHEQQAALAARGEQLVQGLSDKLATIVVTAVERVIASESRAALYDRALRNVRTLMRGAGSISLRVHPDDQPAAQEALQPLLESSSAAIEVIPDGNLPPGSCIFESELGVLDASLSVQLEGLRMALGRAVATATMDAEMQLQQDDAARQQALQAAHDDETAAQGLLSDTSGDFDVSAGTRPASDAVADGDDEHLPYYDEDDEYDHHHDEEQQEHDEHDHHLNEEHAR